MTTLPVPAPEVWLEDDMARSVRAYPLVGLTLGVLLALGVSLLSGLPPLLQGALGLGLWLLLTGALHFDGFCDVADAAFASVTPAERGRILGDVSVGAFALAAASVLLLVKLAALPHVQSTWLVVILLLSRTLVVWPLAHFRLSGASRLGRGARLSKAEANLPLLLGLGLSGAFALVFLELGSYFALLLSAGLSVLGVAAWLERRLDGLNGDAYGALIELSEAVMLVTLVALA